MSAFRWVLLVIFFGSLTALITWAWAHRGIAGKGQDRE